MSEPGRQHRPAGFDAEQLFAWLSEFTAEQRRSRPVFIRVAPKHRALNIQSVDMVECDTYGFFGESLPCIILSPERFCPDQ